MIAVPMFDLSVDLLDLAIPLGSGIDNVIAFEACTYADHGDRLLRDREVLVTRWLDAGFVTSYTLGDC